MHIHITRHRQKPETIDGQLSIDGIHICDCAENAHTALPPGTYPIAIVPCRQYARKMPVVCVSDSDSAITLAKLPSPWNPLEQNRRLYMERAKRNGTPKGQMEQPGTSLGTFGTEPQALLEQRFSAPGTAPSGLPLCSSCHRKPHIGINTKLPRVCPMLKPGNGVYHREDGSIIVGEYLVPGCLKHPKTAFANLFDRIRKSAERGHAITLTIR